MDDRDRIEIERDEALRERRRRRIQEMRREKERRIRQQQMVKKFAPMVAGVMLLLVVGIGVVSAIHGGSGDSATGYTGQNGGAGDPGVEVGQTVADGSGVGADGVAQGTDGNGIAQGVDGVDVGTGVAGDAAAQGADGDTQGVDGTDPVYSASTNERTTAVSSEVVSENAIFIDLDTDTILAERDAHTRISPASMTKVLTLLVAAEQVLDLEDTFTITIDITDYSFVNDCSNVGFEVDETVTIRDLFYGTILPSGADAAVGLATYVAGSQEAFVELMNQKLDELGLADTAHFTNCVGLYDEEHYCTVYDMAMILRAAIDNEFCREVLSAHTYTTAPTKQHPEGIIMSNWFLRRIEDQDTKGEVVGGKTGYVVQSGSCAASYGVDTLEGDYICVTAHSTSSWRCIYDHVALYQQFLPDRVTQ